MKSSKDKKRHSLVALGFLATLPQLAEAGNAITTEEAQRILDAVGRLPRNQTSGQGGPNARLLDLLGIDAQLRQQLEQEVSGNCLQHVAAKAANSATATAMQRLLAADNLAQQVAREAFLDGRAPAEDRLAAVEAVSLYHRLRIPTLTISQSRTFFLNPRVATTLDQTEVYNLFELQAREHARHGTLRSEDTRIELLTFTSDGDARPVTFSFRITIPGQDPLDVRIAGMNIQRGESPAEVVARTLVAAVQYADHLRQPERLRQEINMLRYDLLKLFRVAAPASQAAIRNSVLQLANAGDVGMFESWASYRGRLFQSLLAAKLQILATAQEIQRAMAAQTTPAPVPEGQAGFPLGVVFEERPTQTRLFYRGSQGTTAGYYRPTEVGSRDSNTISTIGWCLDPYFMLTHPWYWGASDNSMMSTLLMFELMSHQGERRHTTDALFIDRPAYDASRFNQPVEPQLLPDNAARPFVDAWETVPAGTRAMEVAPFLGWEATTGSGAGTTPDFSPSPTSTGTSESSGWQAAPPSVPSPAPDTTTTTTTTTGTDFTPTAPTTTTTTTGTDWTTTTTTTTGTDFTTTTTTTTGSDFTTTTTGSDYSSTTTGSSDW